MSFRKILSRPLKKLERRFGRDKRKSDRTGADIAGERSRADSTDLLPQPESSIVAGPGYGTGGSKTDGGEGEVGPSLPQPDNLGAASEGGHEHQVGRGGVGADEGEVGFMGLSLQSGSGAIPESRHGRGNEAVVDEEVDPVDTPPQSYLGISGDKEPSAGM